MLALAMWRWFGGCGGLDFSAAAFIRPWQLVRRRLASLMGIRDTVRILGMGNPLLDVSASVPDTLLTKYGLEPNNAILAEQRHRPLVRELRDAYAADYVAGGATQNAIRVAQWMLQRPGSTAYFGAVGNDDFAERMRQAARRDGVHVQYRVDEHEPTGTCAVLVTSNGQCRSLVADLGAANTYKIEHLRHPDQWQLVEAAKLFYIAGFFLTVSVESALAIGEHVAQNADKTFCMNLSAPFLLQVPEYWNHFCAVQPFVDVYFGNETEACALAKRMGLIDDAACEALTRAQLFEVATALATKTPKRTSRPRTVVFTCGADPIVLVIGDGERLWSTSEYGVIPCPDNDVVDTNGAGDAFVGGFLAMMALGRPIVECVAAGNYAANVVIRQPGCTFPPKPHFRYRGVQVLV
jgi:adenosine kinase